MRPAALVLLLAALTVGCSSTDRYRTSQSYPASARVGDGSGGGQARYVICHKGKHTRTLPEAAVRAHLNHGDRFGACRGDRRGRGNDDRDRSPRRNRRNR